MAGFPQLRRARATFVAVTPERSEQGVGVLLGFRPDRAHLGVDRIDEFARLGPDLDLAAVDGLGKVLRILRAARVALPCDARHLIGKEEEIAALLTRAIGTPLLLELRPRSRIRFRAWTEGGLETVNDVTLVRESPDAFLVERLRGRFPVRVPRSDVLRQRTDCERWYEVLGIERA